MLLYQDFTFEAAYSLPTRAIRGMSFHARLSADDSVSLSYPDGDGEVTTQIADAVRHVRDCLDHRHLNDIDGLRQPTLQAIAIYIWNACEVLLPSLAEVRVSRPSHGDGCIYHGPCSHRNTETKHD